MDRAAPSAPAVAELAPGTRIGRFVIARRIGAGGMGVVYAAHDTELARDVALKVVRPRGDLDAMQARLRREAKAMARLSHRNVVPVFDIGSHDGQLFIAMELVSGEPLRSWVTRPRPWRDVVAVFARAGRGLDAAHAERLAHRDFKPDNVMVGPGDEPRITDFGLARELDEAAGAGPADDGAGELSQVTAAGSVAGTPAYMAPEQLRGERGSAAADQFSFCVSLFEVLYGIRPFQPAGPGPEALLAEIRAGRIARPPARRGVPGWVHAAIVRGLALDPARRWPSLRALVDALERGRRRRLRGAIAVVAALAIAGAIAAARVVPRDGDRGAVASCLDVARKPNDATTILVCQQEYARGNDPRVGSKLADALRRSGRLVDAATLADQLLATPVRADALYTLGKVAGAQGRRDDAERLFRLAGEQHHGQQQWGEAAADLHALALVSNDFVDQLIALDQAVGDARRGDDARTEAFCHLLAADILSKIGARTGALGELDRARPLVWQLGDLVHLELQRGNVYQNLGEHGDAVPAFERAAAGAAVATQVQAAWSARLNLVYSLAESGRLDDAARELEAAAALDPDRELAATRLALEARIARYRRELTRAANLVERAIAETDADADDEMVEREVERAEIALAHPEPAAAEDAARRAIARIERLRATHPPVELRSWMIRDRRAPYSLLFTALASRGDAAGALVAFDRRRGLDVLAGLVHAASEAPPAGASLAFPVADLARWFAALAPSPLAAPRPELEILAAARGVSLLVLVVARDELWRITADEGRLAIARLGAFASLQGGLDRFRAAPADRATAAALGALLVPAELARRSDTALHVVLDEPLAGLPVAALWVGDRPLIAARPVVHAPRASDAGCAASPRDAGAVVIDGAATRGAAAAARHALDVVAHPAPGAWVVVAAGGGDSRARVALAMAYLAAGADQVIAPVAAVSSAAGRRIAAQLARAERGELVRGLARLQASGDADALGFAAFGQDSCNPSP